MAGRPRKVVSTGEASASLVDAQPPQTKPKEKAQTATADLPAHHREHPDKLSGDSLRVLAHRHGMAKSELATMSDEKIRDQLKYLAYRRASE